MPLYEYNCDACGRRVRTDQKVLGSAARKVPDVRRDGAQARVVAGDSVQGHRVLHHRLRKKGSGDPPRSPRRRDPTPPRRRRKTTGEKGPRRRRRRRTKPRRATRPENLTGARRAPRATSLREARAAADSAVHTQVAGASFEGQLDERRRKRQSAVLTSTPSRPASAGRATSR